jgi:hypothetical protein
MISSAWDFWVTNIFRRTRIFNDDGRFDWNKWWSALISLILGMPYFSTDSLVEVRGQTTMFHRRTVYFGCRSPGGTAMRAEIGCCLIVFFTGKKGVWFVGLWFLKWTILHTFFHVPCYTRDDISDWNWYVWDGLKPLISPNGWSLYPWTAIKAPFHVMYI